MITIPVFVDPEGNRDFDRTQIPSDAVRIVMDGNVVTVYQRGDQLPEEGGNE